MRSLPKFSHAQHRSSASSRRSTVLILASCLLIGIPAFFFVISEILGPRHCSNAEPRSVRVVWERGSGDGNGNRISGYSSGGDQKRHKVMGFVGIQTGFGSVGRRQSLRQTWMPSDRQGLERCGFPFPLYSLTSILVAQICIYLSLHLLRYVRKRRLIVTTKMLFSPLIYSTISRYY